MENEKKTSYTIHRVEWVVGRTRRVQVAWQVRDAAGNLVDSYRRRRDAAKVVKERV